MAGSAARLWGRHGHRGGAERCPSQPGESVAVLGCGGVGLQVIAGARLAGADPIIAVDRVSEKLELAHAQGATHAIDTTGEKNR